MYTEKTNLFSQNTLGFGIYSKHHFPLIIVPSLVRQVVLVSYPLFIVHNRCSSFYSSYWEVHILWQPAGRPPDKMCRWKRIQAK